MEIAVALVYIVEIRAQDSGVPCLNNDLRRLSCVDIEHFSF